MEVNYKLPSLRGSRKSNVIPLFHSGQALSPAKDLDSLVAPFLQNDISKKRLLYLLIIILELALTFGCSESSRLSNKNTVYTPSKSYDLAIPTNLTSRGESTAAIPTTILTPAPFQETIPTEGLCDWPPEKITLSKVRSFLWSGESQLIFSKSGTDQEEWYLYDVSSHLISPYKPKAATPDTNKKIAADFGIANFVNIFLKPDQSSVVYTVKSTGSYLVYFQRKGEKRSSLLGEIYGQIDQNYWLQDGDRLILSIDWQAPDGITDAYLYLVNLAQGNIEIVIPNQPEYTNLTFLGVTPDEKRVLFVKFSGKDRNIYLFDLYSHEIKRTKVHFPWTYRWIPGKNEFIAVGYLVENGSPELFSFDVDNFELRRLSRNPLTIHPNFLNGVQISPNLKYIAFVDENDLGFYLLDCSNAIRVLLEEP